MSATMQGTTRKRPASTSRMLKALAFLTPAAIMILIFVFYPVIQPFNWASKVLIYLIS